MLTENLKYLRLGLFIHYVAALAAGLYLTDKRSSVYHLHEIFRQIFIFYYSQFHGGISLSARIYYYVVYIVIYMYLKAENLDVSKSNKEDFCSDATKNN